MTDHHHLLFLRAVLLISCFVHASLSYNFNDQNLIRLVSDDAPTDDDFESTLLSISPSIEAIYQFGDSISDTGNFVRDDPQSHFNKSPYGETYFHYPTGRCSDGLLMVDYLAEFLNLPLLDAYLNKDGNFSHGVNFAVAGATAMDISTLATTYNVVPDTNRSLSVQLGWFKSHLASTCSNESECRKKVAKSLIMMGEIGGNDFNWALLSGQHISNVYEMVPQVVHTIKRAVQAIINLGATRIVVPGNFPVGCLTVYLAAFKTDDSEMYDEFGCLIYLNEFAKFQNDQLKETIQDLRKDYPNVGIVYGDYYAPFIHILNHATDLGFDKNTMYKACCGKGENDFNLDFSNLCGSGRDEVCQNPNEYVSWDGVHLTQHTYHIMAKWLFRDFLFGFSNITN